MRPLHRQMQPGLPTFCPAANRAKSCPPASCGNFFDSYERRTGVLLVKVPEARFNELVATAKAHAFAPAGHRFREWAAVPFELHQTWTKLIHEALTFVDHYPGKSAARRPMHG